MSLELKRLLSLLFVTVAAWVWANTTSPYAEMSLSTVSAQAPAAEEAPAEEAEDPEAEDPEAASQELEAQEPAPAPVQAQDDLPASARELRIATLPFLVTEEPVIEEEALPLPQGARVTVNPFAPIVRPPADSPEAVPTPATVSPVPVTPPAAVDVPVRPPEGALQPPPLPAGVAALPVVPEAPAMSRLPRAVPSATLPAAPALLQQQRDGNGIAGAPPPQSRADLAARVATALPEGARNAIPAERLPEAATAMARVSEPTPLLRPRGADGADGADGPASLRNYLLEHEVAYAGSVLGPVGVGIFRTNSGTVVVALGQTLPRSDIVVTYVDGRQAELSLADSKETLPIDPGR